MATNVNDRCVCLSHKDLQHKANHHKMCLRELSLIIGIQILIGSLEYRILNQICTRIVIVILTNLLPKLVAANMHRQSHEQLLPWGARPQPNKHPSGKT